MVNPLVNAVANSLGRSTPCLYPIQATLRLDFFTPRPRPSTKGKEPALDTAPLSASTPAPSSSDGGKSAPLRHRIRGSSAPKRHTSQRRHASSSSSSLPSSHAAVRVRLFIELEHEWTAHEAQLAWTAYTQSQTQAMVLTLAETLRFAAKISASATTFAQRVDLDPTETVHTWGVRIHELLDVVEGSVEPGTKEDVLCKASRAQAFAFEGRVDEADALADRLKLNTVSRHAVYSVLVIAAKLHQGDERVLDFVARRWSQISPYMHIPPADTTPGLKALQEAIHRSVTAIPDYIAFLTARPHSAERNYLGELFIHHLCKRRLSGEALKVLKALEATRQRLPDKLHLVLARALARDKAFASATALFEGVVSRSSNQEPHWQNRTTTGLYIYARQGLLSKAESYFYELESHVPTPAEKGYGWVKHTDITMIMFAYVVAKKADGAADLFVQFFPTAPNGLTAKKPIPAGNWAKPDLVHYSTIILGYAKVAEFVAMNQWLAAMTTAGFTPDMHVYTIILRSFAQRGDVASVGAILEQMLTASYPPDNTVYTIIVTLFANRRDPVSAEAMFMRAVKEGIIPDRRLVTILMEAHVQASSWQGVIRIFDYISSSPSLEVRMSVEVYNTLLKAYVKIGAPFKVVAAIFGQMEGKGIEPTDRSYALLLQAAVDAGKMDIAESIFAEMDKLAQQWQSGFHISTYTLNIMLAGYLRQKDKTRAKATYAALRERGLQPDANTFAIVLRGYANNGSDESLQVAEAFLASLVENDVDIRVWNKPTYGSVPALEATFMPLMGRYVYRNEPENVERLFQLLLDKGGEPSINLLTTLMDSYRRVCDWDGVEQVWAQIVALATSQSLIYDSFVGNAEQEKQLGPHQRRANVLCIPLSIYADAMSVAVRDEKIAEVWGKLQSLGFAFDAHNWNHLVLFLHRSGEYERAFQIVEHILLPYQRESQRASDERDRSPESPFMYDKPPPLQNDGTAAPLRPAVVDNAQRSFRRTHASIRNRGKLPVQSLVESVPDDAAHALHVIHNMTPQWNSWAPFGKTLAALHGMLAGLSMGVPPHKYDCITPYRFWKWYHPRHRPACYKLRDHIEETYPNAVTAAKNFMTTQSARRLQAARAMEWAETFRRSKLNRIRERDERERWKEAERVAMNEKAKREGRPWDVVLDEEKLGEPVLEGGRKRRRWADELKVEEVEPWLKSEGKGGVEAKGGTQLEGIQHA